MPGLELTFVTCVCHYETGHIEMYICILTAVLQPCLPAEALLFWIIYKVLGSHYLAQHVQPHSASEWLHPVE